MKQKTSSKIKNNNLDKFEWLETISEKTNLWLKEQQKLTEGYFINCKNRVELKKQYKKLFYTDYMGLPVFKNGFYFFNYRKKNEENYSICVQKGLEGKRSVLINPLELPFEQKFVIKHWSVSENAKWLALELSIAGNDKSEIKIFDIENKSFVKDCIPSDLYPYFNSWNKTETGFWYSKGCNYEKGQGKYYKRIYFHKIGEDVSSDQIWFGDNLEKIDWPSITCSPDRKYALVTVRKKDDRTIVFFRDLENPNSKFVNITKGMHAESHAVFGDGYIYLKTNHDAPNGKIVRMEISQNMSNKWVTYIPEKKSKLDNFIVTKNYLFLEYIENAQSMFYSVDLRLERQQVNKIRTSEFGTITGISAKFDGDYLFFGFSSFSTPNSIYKIDLKNLTVDVFWKLKISTKLPEISIKQIWFRSKDGARIPMFVVHKKNLPSITNKPALVYAYGGFNISITPHFIKDIIPFLDAGGIYVSVNIRGGGEFGETWHKMGTLKNKQNSFDDFAYALKYLVKNKYTSPEKIAIWGASNGGLLVSTMLTQNSKLFKTAIVEVPVTDMLRFHLFNGGRWWISEYGNPLNKQDRAVLMKYSPYHNVKEINYPSAMFCVSDQDDRVHPMHSYKMVAKLKNNPAQKNPILLHVEKEAGHSGGNKISSIVDTVADQFAFLFKELGI